jgi:predicted small lipoprotein YifL
MKPMRFTLLLAVMCLAGCVSPAGPQYPQDDENTSEQQDKNKSGMVVTTDRGIFA